MSESHLCRSQDGRTAEAVAKALCWVDMPRDGLEAGEAVAKTRSPAQSRHTGPRPAVGQMRVLVTVLSCLGDIRTMGPATLFEILRVIADKDWEKADGWSAVAVAEKPSHRGSLQAAANAILAVLEKARDRNAVAAKALGMGSETKRDTSAEETARGKGSETAPCTSAEGKLHDTLAAERERGTSAEAKVRDTSVAEKARGTSTSCLAAEAVHIHSSA